jgi:hypothetical protein
MLLRLLLCPSDKQFRKSAIDNKDVPGYKAGVRRALENDGARDFLLGWITAERCMSTP